MINILPDHGRATARRIYRLRLVAIVLWAAAIACLIAAGLLSPAYFRALASEAASRAESAALGEGNVKNKDADELLAAATTYVEAYAPYLSGLSIGERIVAISEARPAGITFSRIGYEKGSDSVRVSGIASTRDALLSFEKSLRTLPHVEAVELPVSDLAKSTQAPFSVSVRFAPPQP